jgi:hypothetical protein
MDSWCGKQISSANTSMEQESLDDKLKHPVSHFPPFLSFDTETLIQEVLCKTTIQVESMIDGAVKVKG